MPNINNISQDLINKMSDTKTIVNSFSNSFDSDFNTNTFNISWDNTVQTITDPYLSNGGKVTVNKNYLPTTRFTNSRGKSLSSITAPPDYLTAMITLFRGSNKIMEIPVLFNATISNSISASYVKESPVGSSSPIVAFNYTGEETFPFSFVALAEYLPSGFSSLKSYVEAIKEIVKPGYSDNLVLAPYVILTFADISVKCICESVSVSYDQIYNTNSFAKADIQCSFTKIRDV